MIHVYIKRNVNAEICAFKVENHGDAIVCASVSILVINTVNCIEVFIGEEMLCFADQEKGIIDCIFPQLKKNKHNHDVNLLLNTMLYGLSNISVEYDNEICIFDEEVSAC